MPSTQTPIAAKAAEIVYAVQNNDVVVILGPTGSGKSTEIGPILYRAGYRVTVTQPRRLPARNVAIYVAKKMQAQLGQLVGWKTGDGGETSERTRVEFVTDGLLLRRLISGHLRDNVIYVLDEVHERSTILDTLMALLRRAKEQGAKYKVVLMSATFAPAVLAAYYGKLRVAIIETEGRMFPITEEPAGTSVEADAIQFAQRGLNPLVFQSSVSKVHQMVSRIRSLSPAVTVYPLYADMEPAEQDQVMRHRGGPAIVVCTPVAQTSLTIPYINAVVDDGYEFREEVEDGVKGLAERRISRACGKQREGRGGRVAPGFVRRHYDIERCEPFPTPEILRVPLAETVLDLLQDEIDIRELAWLDQPSAEQIATAIGSLKALGFITEVEGRLRITEHGREAADYPVECHIDRMLIEARKRGCLSEIIKIAALAQVGGILERRNSHLWANIVGPEKESDLLAELAAFRWAKDRSRSERREAGINSRDCDDAIRVERKLRAIFHDEISEKPGARKDILMSITAGMVDHLYCRTARGNYRDIDRETATRSLDRFSVIESGAKWVVASPFNVAGKQIVNMATKVDPIWFCEMAPHLVETTVEGVRFDSITDGLVGTTRTKFRGELIAEQTGPIGKHPEAAKLFAEWLAAAEPTCIQTTAPAGLAELLAGNREILKRGAELNVRQGEQLFPETTAQLSAHYQAKLGGISSLGMISDANSLQLVLDSDLVALVELSNPTTVKIGERDYAVVYARSSAPKIDFTAEDILAGVLETLPDNGVVLPGERQIELRFNDGYWSPTSYGTGAEAVTRLRAEAPEKAKDLAWERWEKPVVAVPDLSGPNAKVPPVQEVLYWREFKAFWAVVLDDGYSAEPTFKVEWARDYWTLEYTRRIAAERLEQIVSARSEAELQRQEAERQRLAAEAEAKRKAALKPGELDLSGLLGKFGRK